MKAVLAALAAALLCLAALPARAQEAQTVLHLLDYLGVDYAGAVETPDPIPAAMQDTARTVAAAAPASSPPEPRPRQPSDFLNRELSWLEFNRRVLEEALDPGNRLLERVKRRPKR